MRVENSAEVYREDFRGPLTIQVSTPARLAFIRKVYTLFSLAIALFVGAAWLGTTSDAVFGLVAPIFRLGLVGVLLVMAGLFFMLRATAARYPLNIVALMAFGVLEGLLTAPLLRYALWSDPVGGATTIAKAASMTLVVFGGLTLYTLTSKRDFSFLRMGLWAGFFVLLGMGLVGMLFGFDTTGFGISLAWVVLMAGFLIYDTSNVMRRYPPHMAATAAAVIFLDVVILFQRLLMLLMSRRR